MRKRELKRYQEYAREVIKRIREQEAYGEDLSEVKKLLGAFLQSLKEGDSFQADYMMQLINSALESKGEEFFSKVGAESPPKFDFMEDGRRRKGRSGWVKSYGEKGAKMPRRISPLMVILVAILLFLSTLGIASAKSLPDSTLYPVKRGMERLRGGLIFTSSGKASFELSLAEERLKEAEEMEKRGEEGLAREALSDMKEHIKKGKIWAEVSSNTSLLEKIFKEEERLLKKAEELGLEVQSSKGKGKETDSTKVKKEAEGKEKVKKEDKDKGGKKEKGTKETKGKEKKKNSSGRGKSKKK
jgi:hypothetical protein